MGEVIEHRSQSQQLATSTADHMLQLAIEKGASLEQLEKLMDLKERHDANEARKAFAAAMAAFRAEAPQIEKNAEVDYTHNGKRTNYRHSSLDYICAKINPILGKHQLTFSWETEQRDRLITVHCDVSHVMGHKQRTTLMASPDESGGKNSVQAIGSTVSYLQRYTLLSALGLATGGQDDDGRGSDPLQTITTEQAAEIKADLKATNSDTKAFLKAMGGYASVDELPASVYNRAKTALAKKKIQQQGAE